VCCSALQCVAVCCSDSGHAFTQFRRCVAVCCSVLQCVAVLPATKYARSINSDGVLQCVPLCCSVLHDAAVCCSALQSVVVCCRACSVLQYVSMLPLTVDVLALSLDDVFPYVAERCIFLQCVAVCCSVL